MLTVYTKPVCPYCDQLKSLLTTKGVEYEEIAVDADNREFLMSCGVRSVPAVFDGEIYMGGFAECRDFFTHNGGNND